jgi:multiple sugar transport system permease protein
VTGPGPGSRSGARAWRQAWPFLLPGALLAAVFLLVPILETLRASFYLDVSFMERRFGGLENYRALLADPAFRQACVFTGLFALVSVPLETALGLAFALILGRDLPLRGLLRAVVLIPWAIPAAVSARTFELIYQYHHGLANAALSWAGLADRPINWLGTAPGAFIALVAADAWKTTPFAALLFLAGLAGIPGDLARQAKVDGAHFLQRFRHITLPLLKPVIAVVIIFRAVDALRVFDLNYVLTGGGPGGSTTSLSLLGYRHYLSGDFGLGAAVSVALFLAALAFTVLYARRSQFLEAAP